MLYLVLHLNLLIKIYVEGSVRVIEQPLVVILAVRQTRSLGHFPNVCVHQVQGRGQFIVIIARI
jgi:hypothetical protein